MSGFEDRAYVPLLSLKPAEMRAVDELPNATKDRLLPFFFLKRWGASNRLVGSIERIQTAIGDRPAILELCPPQPFSGARQQVHDELDQLGDPSNGYQNWVEFFAENNQFIPSLQIGNLLELPNQAASLEGLGRGLVLRLPPPTFPFITDLVNLVSSAIQGSENILVIVDFERADRFLLNRQSDAVSYVSTIRSRLPDAFIATSASSFPESFTSVSSQEIYERLLFEGVKHQIGADGLIYSDRGSARVEALGGGGGEIPPRIDYAAPAGWEFFRADSADNKDAGYQEQAQAAMESEVWDEDLRVWGTQLIELTADGDESGIYSQSRAAAARINIHLHQQQYFGSDDLYLNDEDWQD